MSNLHLPLAHIFIFPFANNVYSLLFFFARKSSLIWKNEYIWRNKGTNWVWLPAQENSIKYKKMKCNSYPSKIDQAKYTYIYIYIYIHNHICSTVGVPICMLFSTIKKHRTFLIERTWQHMVPHDTVHDPCLHTVSQ